MSIPQVAHGGNSYWERLGGAREVERTISSRTIRFFVEPTRTDSVYPCTVDDVALLISNLPHADWEGIGAIVFRQPKRKEETLAPVWGRLCYTAELIGHSERVVYSGAAVILEAINPNRPLRFGKTLSIEGRAELERLEQDGHQRRDDKRHSLEMTLESCRTTQLYRTLPHELGHWVDFLEKVERHASQDKDYGILLDRYHSRPFREKEQFAHSYAERLRRHLVANGAIPFPRQLDAQRLAGDKLRVEDFVLSTR